MNTEMTNKEQVIKNFPVDGAGVDNGKFFGLPFSVEQADLVLLSVPWDATVSYGEGTHQGPEAMIEASVQGEIYDELFVDSWKKGIATAEPIEYAKANNKPIRTLASRIIEDEEAGGILLSQSEREELLEQVNSACRRLNEEVYQQSKNLLEKGKIIGLVGGEHSVPLGLLRALSDSVGEFGILHIDAHADLRDAYEGFEYSHASIMFNAMKDERITALSQVAIRDQCYGEAQLVADDKRINQFTSHDLRSGQFEGETWAAQCKKIIATLPQKVYISFDIDGLSPELCPSTGTPVAGGLGFDEALYLLRVLAQSGRELVGFDLCEVAPSAHDGDQWDANVGARILYKLCGCALQAAATTKSAE